LATCFGGDSEAWECVNLGFFAAPLVDDGATFGSPDL
jgi:hypothetical protein